jgi:hypothetical protein
MRRPFGFALAAVGVVLLIWGISAADSFASDVSRFFSGSPTDRAIWLTIGGIAAIVAGGVMASLPGRALN